MIRGKLPHARAALVAAAAVLAAAISPALAQTISGAGGTLLNPSTLGSVTLQQTASQPSNALAAGSLSLFSGVNPRPYFSLGAPFASPAFVQSANSNGGTYTYAVTMPSGPANGDFLIAAAFSSSGAPSANTGWNVFATHAPGCTTDPNMVLLWKKAGAGEPTGQTPATGATGAIWGSEVIEVSGLGNTWGPSLETVAFNCGFMNNPANTPQTVNTTATSTMVNNLALSFVGISMPNGFPGYQDITPSWNSGWVNTRAGSVGNSPGEAGWGVASQAFPTYGSSVTAATTWNDTFTSLRPSGMTAAVIILGPGANQGAQPLSFLTAFKNQGAAIEINPTSFNCVVPLTCSSDGAGDITATTTGGGTVTSVDATVPSDESVSGGPVTGTGTLAITRNSQSANLFLASPNGSSGIPAYRAIVAADIPSAPSISGTPTTGDCVKWTSATQIGDQGAACGSGGGGGTTNNYYGGAMTLVEQHSAANSATLDFTNFASSSTYDEYLVEVGGLVPGTNSTTLKMLTSADSGATWQSANYYWQVYGQDSAGGVGGSHSTADTSFTIGDGSALSNTAVNGGSLGTLHLTNLQTSSQYFTYQGDIAGYFADGLYRRQVIGGRLLSATAVNALRFQMSSGNIASGWVRIYGVAKTTNVTVNPQPGLPVICEIVTSGSQTSVTVGGGSGSCPTLPQTYRDLQVVVSGATPAATVSDTLALQFNGDTSTSYRYELGLQTGTTGTTGQQSASSGSILACCMPGSSNGVSNDSGQVRFNIANYGNSAFLKTVQSQGLVRNADTAGNYYISPGSGWWNSTSAITSLKVTMGSGGAFKDGSVVTVYGIGGNVAATLPVVPPQGRLTLTSNTPVMTTDATAATTLYYTPYVGSLLPIGNVMYRFGQISYALGASAHLSGNLYDVFAYNSSGALALCTGPAWTNSTTRSAAIQMDAINSIWENSSGLTCTVSGGGSTTTIAAGQATYVGTVYATANGQTAMQLNAAAATGGSNPCMCLYNAYNRVDLASVERDSAGNWTYGGAGSNSPRPTDNSTSNRIRYVDGLGQSTVIVDALEGVSSGAGTTQATVGVGLNSTTAYHSSCFYDQASSSAQYGIRAACSFPPTLGFNYAQELEALANGTSTITFLSFSVLSGLRIHLSM